MFLFLITIKLFKVEIIKYHKNFPPRYKRQNAKICQKKVFYGFYLFCPGDLVTRTGEWEIRSVTGRLPDNLGELAKMHTALDFALT